jgi:hypothetical protein
MNLRPMKHRSVLFLKIFIISYFILHNSYFIFAQTKSEEIQLAKDEEVIEIINIGKNGLIVETVNTDNYKFTFRHFTASLDEGWNTLMNMSSPQFKTSTSVLTNYVYITNQTLQLDLANKTSQRFEVSDLPPGRVFRAYFQDDRYWYGMYYVKFNDTYLMRRLEHSSRRMKEIFFKLPKGKDYLYSTEWYFINNDDKNSIWVYDKTTGYQHMGHFKNNKFNYEIINLDTAMTVKKDIRIDVNLDSIYVCPSLNFRKEHELPSPAADFEFTTKGMKSIWVPKPEAYSSIIYEPANRNFYIYGLWSKDPFHESDNKSEVKGFFILRYDVNGNLLNKTVSRLPNDTAVYAGFDIKTLMTFTPDNKLVFQIYFDKISQYKLKVRGEVYTFIYADNKLLNQYSNTVPSGVKKDTDPLTYDFVIDNLQHFDFIPGSSDLISPVEFYELLNNKQKSINRYRLYRYQNSSILVEEEKTNRMINLYLFNK